MSRAKLQDSPTGHSSAGPVHYMDDLSSPVRDVPSQMESCVCPQAAQSGSALQYADVYAIFDVNTGPLRGDSWLAILERM